MIALTRETVRQGQAVLVVERATGNEWSGTLNGWGAVCVEVTIDLRSRRCHRTKARAISFHHAAVQVYAITTSAITTSPGPDAAGRDRPV